MRSNGGLIFLTVWTLGLATLSNAEAQPVCQDLKECVNLRKFFSKKLLNIDHQISKLSESQENTENLTQKTTVDAEKELTPLGGRQFFRFNSEGRIAGINDQIWTRLRENSRNPSYQVKYLAEVLRQAETLQQKGVLSEEVIQEAKGAIEDYTTQLKKRTPSQATDEDLPLTLLVTMH